MLLSSVHFSHSVMSDSLPPHELQHARPPCPSPTPGVHSDSRPSSQWCHPAISSLVVPFSSCPQSLQASESFPMSQLFSWGGQSTEVSALASFLPKKSQGWSPSEWTGWIFLQSKGLSRVLSHRLGSEGGMIWENGMETCILSYMKRITSPGLMHDTGCLGLVHWNRPERWYGREEGGGFRMGNTCIPVADTCWCMAKPIQYCKVINLQLKQINLY